MSEDGLRHGLGTLYHADGTVYEGEWKNGKKDGQCRFTKADGRVYEGFLQDGHMFCQACYIKGEMHDGK